MNLKPTDIYTFTVPANGVYRLHVQGEYFKILAATGSVNVLADWGRLKGLTAGQGLEESEFKHLIFEDTTGADNALRVVIGDQRFIDGMSGAVEVSKAVVPRSAAFDNLNKTVTNADGQLLAAKATRQYLLIQNRDLTGSLFIAFGKAATAAAGVRIAPGGFYELAGGVCTTQEIRAIGDIANNPNVVTVEG